MSTGKEIYEQTKYEYLSKDKFSYEQDPEQFDRGFRQLCKYPPERKTADVERIIVDFLKFKGFLATRQETKGRMIDNTKIGTDSIGRLQVYGSKQWIPGTSKKGKADVRASIYGVTVEIEVKFSKGDKQRESQKQYEAELTSGGGIYMIVKNGADFIEKFDSLMNHPKIILNRDFELNKNS